MTAAPENCSASLDHLFKRESPTMTASFDAENLIGEIEKRPCLWDVRSTDYPNKAKKTRMWTEVAKALHPDFNQFESSKKRSFEQDIQKKWKGIRSSFARELQKMKNPQSGPRKTYVYYELLQFLLPVMGMKTSNTSTIEEEYYRENITEEENSTETEVKQWVSDGWPTSCYPNPPKKAKSTASQDDLPHLNSRRARSHSREDHFDDDKLFLLSLLPEIKKVPEDSKLECRMAIMSNIMHFRARRQGQLRDSTPPKPHPFYSRSPSPQ